MASDSTRSNLTLRYQVQGAREAEASSKRVAKSVKDVGDQADRASKKTGHLDQSLKTMGAFRWASYAGFATVATGIASVTHEALGFEDAMAKVRAISMDDPSLNFEQHWKDALVVARDFRATGAETANALYQIAAAGVPASEQMDVLRGSLSLAAATGYDQAAAAQTQLGILNSFGLGMEESTRVADMLTQAVNISAIGMEDLAYTMKYVSAPAEAAGQSLEEILGIIALLGKRGMRGENVGTGLATGLQRLVDPSEEAVGSLKEIGLTMDSFKGADGNLKPITEIMDMMTVALKRAPDDFARLRIVSDVFGKDAADVWMSLFNAFDQDRVGVQLLLNQFGEFEGKAKQTAAVMDDTVTASLDKLWGAITEVTTSKFMGERGGIQDWIDDLTTKVENFDLNKWIDENRESIDSFMASAEAFGTLMTEGVVPAFSALHEALSPALIPVLEAMRVTLEFMADNAETLKPLIYAMTAMYIASKVANLTVPGLPGLPGKGKTSTTSTAGKTIDKAKPFATLFWPTAGIAATAAGVSTLDKIAEDQLGGGFGWPDPGMLNPFRRVGRPSSHAPIPRVIPPPPVHPDRISADQIARYSKAGDREPINLNLRVELDGREVAHAVTSTVEDRRSRR